MRSRGLVLVGLIVLLGACSSGDVAEQITESQDGVESVDIDESTGQVDVETEDGSISIGGGDLPEDLPVDVPSGGEVVAQVDGEGQSTVVVSYSGKSFEELTSFYEDWVADSGLEVLQTVGFAEPPSMAWTLDYQDGGAITIVVSDDGLNVAVQVTVVNG